jgi:RNA polymerase sigma-70 factor, ECF subfamily
MAVAIIDDIDEGESYPTVFRLKTSMGSQPKKPPGRRQGQALGGSGDTATSTFRGRIVPMTTETPASLAFEFESNIRNATDDLLIVAAQSGNGPAFVELSRRHSKRIQLQVYRILGNWEDAEDVLQDSLLKALKHLGQFRGACRFSTWLTRIAINSALMVMRKRRVRLETSYDRNADSTETVESCEFPDLSPSPERLCADREAEELLRSAILQLPRCCRTVAELYHAKECSTNEIAQALGISVSAAKSRLSRARATLRASLPELGLSIETLLRLKQSR